MAIRDWHTGQLGVLWVGGIALDAAVYWSLSAIPVTTHPIDPPYINSQPVGDILLLLLSIMVFVIPLILLILAWKWFGSRKRSPEP